MRFIQLISIRYINKKIWCLTARTHTINLKSIIRMEADYFNNFTEDNKKYLKANEV